MKKNSPDLEKTGYEKYATCRHAAGSARFWSFAGAAELSKISDDPRDAVCDEEDMQGV